MTDLVKTRERARLVRDDVPEDAEKLDRTPFTQRGVGETFGTLLAMIRALAQCCVELSDALVEPKENG